jgi:hypothetical protein
VGVRGRSGKLGEEGGSYDGVRLGAVQKRYSAGLPNNAASG